MTDKPVPEKLPHSIIDALPNSTDFATSIIDCAIKLYAVRKDLERCQKTGDAIQMARAFVVLHRLKAKLDELGELFSGVFENYKTAVIPTAFAASGVTSVPLAEGFRIGVSSLLRASIKPGMKEAAYEWLRNNGHGDLITDTINSSTLSGAARHLDEQENKELPVEFFNVVRIPTTSVTRTRTKE